MLQEDGLVPLPLNTIHIAYAELCQHVDITLGVFRIDVSVMIQLLFHGVIQIMNLGARNVGNAKQP
jgi:hypothetical protein